MAGTLPVLRSRRASCLPLSVLTSASITSRSIDACSPDLNFSDEERADGGLLVNGLDGAGQQRRDAQDHDAAAFPGFFRGRDGVGDHHLLDLRLANPPD